MVEMDVFFHIGHLTQIKDRFSTHRRQMKVRKKTVLEVGNKTFYTLEPKTFPESLHSNVDSGRFGRSGFVHRTNRRR